MGRHTHRHVILWALVLLLALVVEGKAFAFVRSEEELMRAEVEQAKARARDFKKYQARAAEAEKKREAAVNGHKAVKRVDEEQLEQTRQRYIAERNKKRIKELGQDERLEQILEEQRQKDQKAKDVARKDYLRKRERVRATIEREGHIDEAEEYDLKWRGENAAKR